MVGWSANAPSGSISCSAGGRGAGAPLAVAGMGRQFSYGSLVREREKDPAGERELAGSLSASGSLSTLSWAATAMATTTRRWGKPGLTLPLGESINVNLQNMLASDSSWSSVGSISATLPGGFSSVWVNQERTRIGDQLAAQRCRQPGDRPAPST
ncbi:CFA/I fimbrial subunit C usher protein [Klebsiella pneumoniae]|uniref:CFA/I fimbrial subunit C usher protein n=1 Tax=Klebsiella pneumoniae TaxID=573 RepID=A0A3S4H453_KLEPN|nr:CFA/I fimbrial subunit C usher protein [Klebsiella pneumoniae]